MKKNGKKPVIAVLPQYAAQADRMFLVLDYVRAIRCVGGIPVVLPLYMTENDYRDLEPCFDGYLFPGGPDLWPGYYGEETRAECREILPERDRLELGILKMAIAGRKPVLGVCRGIQVMNVALGGTLYQDMSLRRTQNPLVHEQREGDYVRTHSVKVMKETLLHKITGRDFFPVNSFHHQACRKIADGLRVCAVADDGAIEAVELPGFPFFLGVQWHAEHFYGEDGPDLRIWQAFLEAAVEAMGKRDRA